LKQLAYSVNRATVSPFTRRACRFYPDFISEYDEGSCAKSELA